MEENMSISDCYPIICPLFIANPPALAHKCERISKFA